MKALAVSVPGKVVAVAVIRVQILAPDVGQLVLVQLQQLLKRREIFGLGFAANGGHVAQCSLAPADA